MSTIKDVAKQAGVSVATVSYVLNNDPRVSEQTRQKVLSVVDALNYRPNATARNLKRRKTETIALFVTGFGGPFFSSVIEGLQEVVESNGYDLIACSTGNDSSSRFLQEKLFDAAVVFGPTIPDELLVQMASRSFPIAVMDRELKADHVHQVLINNVQGAYNATKHLAGLGYRTIGYLSGGVNSYNNQKRFEGYKSALEDAGLPFQIAYTAQGHFTEQGGYQATRSLIMSGKVPEAIFSANDEMAIGCIQALTEAGYKVPEDVAIVGFDDLRISSYVRPALTTIKHPMREWGSIVTHTIFQALLDGLDEPKKIMLDTELVVRESCGIRLKKTVSN
ncbi:LacI family DNA-binding transcriptional regulator [Paenibacillus sp. MWE-103]|uniref:LacI family DNA-binding transcriptional regulator n=1 Tax=Paenibacillus artemisiicola TaxID=1172618 RepID=A0ABS3WAM8_9BACL|nr:LacI family DNA-binding transcriptional regulator [Paenibacillus artemisiicola]MBO7745364.1 LacI family DNA-binding transcriptional regulator [Paenibacillus artemisiicola]